ncbi:MAG: DMT family transporter [Pseudomonadota bacterium]
MVAIFAMLGACILLAGTTLMAKMLGSGSDGLGLHPLQITSGRFVFAWFAIAGVAAAMRPDFKGMSWANHVARSLLGFASGTCLFAAAALMPLASATALSFLSPLITMVCAMIFLAERVGPWRWSAAVIALIGAFVLTGPGSETFQWAALIAIAAALFMGVEGIFIKRLSDTEPPVRILFVNNSIGAIVAVTAALFVWQWPTTDGWLLLAALGLTMVTAQAMFIQAMKRGDASFLVPLWYMVLVIAGVFDYAVFSVIPSVQAMIGAALIVCGAIIISLRGQNRQAGRERTKQRPERAVAQERT